MRSMKPVILGQVRRERGMSKAELARAARMQAGVVAWVEDGRYIPYESQLQKLAAALEWKGEPIELLEEVS